MGKRAAKLRKEWDKFKARYIYRGRLHNAGDTLVFEATNICTLRCSCCPNGLDSEHCRPRHRMSLEECKVLVNNIDIPISNVFLHLHGEPLTNNELPEIANCFYEKGVRKFTVFSNGYNIDMQTLEGLLRMPADAEWKISFSAELYDKSQYENIRTPGKFAEMEKNLKGIDDLMGRYRMGYSINAIIDAEDLDMLPERVVSIFESYPHLESIQFSSRFPWPYLPETGDLAGRLKMRRSICTQTRELPVVMSNGDVSLCSSDYRGDCVVGSLMEHKFSELMDNKQARRFRLNHLNHHPERNVPCKDCLIDRYRGFSRKITGKFVKNASEQNLQKFFDSFRKYYVYE